MFILLGLLAIGLTGWILYVVKADHLGAIPYTPTPFLPEEPAGFVKMAIPEDNPMTYEGIDLGRRLFYDPVLSVDSSLSCAGCHLPERSFTDGLRLSRGIEGDGRRNVPSLINVGYYYKGLFWDGRSTSLEEQALHPVSNPVELANDWGRVEALLQQHEVYPDLFRKAFGIETAEEIDRYLVAKALAQFQRTLISADSKFDRVQRKEAEFTASERRGWEIFFDFPGGLPMAECGHCHSDPLFSDLNFHNNGLGKDGGEEDIGRMAASQRETDRGKFRTPTLRNIIFTAPYMHDGRFGSLEEVVEHYASGGHYGSNVNPNVRPLELSRENKRDLIAFLNTLSDTTFVKKASFQNPF